MKIWQLCALLGAICAAPHMEEWVGVFTAFLYLIAACLWYFVERKDAR